TPWTQDRDVGVDLGHHLGGALGLVHLGRDQLKSQHVERRTAPLEEIVPGHGLARLRVEQTVVNRGPVSLLLQLQVFVGTLSELLLGAPAAGKRPQQGHAEGDAARSARSTPPLSPRSGGAKRRRRSSTHDRPRRPPDAPERRWHATRGATGIPP